jgi:branched-subunit amino acid aminotransferase/4-amino-4-deoxychorismate lyase
MPEIHIYTFSAGHLEQRGIEQGTLDTLTQRLPRGLYTTFRTFENGRRALDLRHHLQRLYGPALTRGIQPQVGEEALRAALRQIAARFAPGECRLRPILLLEERAGELYILAEAFSPPSPDLYEKGVSVITVPIPRRHPRLKSTDFIALSAEIRQKLAQGKAYEAIRVRLTPHCPRGEALEGLTSNFYVLRGRTLITAAEGILPGITRRVVLRLARQKGLEILYRRPCLGENFEEAFLTSSSRGVVPVVAIDGQRVGKGEPGPHTRALGEAYDRYVASHAEMI